MKEVKAGGKTNIDMVEWEQVILFLYLYFSSFFLGKYIYLFPSQSHSSTINNIIYPIWANRLVHTTDILSGGPGAHWYIQDTNVSCWNSAFCQWCTRKKQTMIFVSLIMNIFSGLEHILLCQNFQEFFHFHTMSSHTFSRSKQSFLPWPKAWVNIPFLLVVNFTKDYSI